MENQILIIQLHKREKNKIYARLRRLQIVYTSKLMGEHIVLFIFVKHQVVSTDVLFKDDKLTRLSVFTTWLLSDIQNVHVKYYIEEGYLNNIKRNQY